MQHGRFCPAETLIYVNKLVFCSKTLKRFDFRLVHAYALERVFNDSASEVRLLPAVHLFNGLLEIGQAKENIPIFRENRYRSPVPDCSAAIDRPLVHIKGRRKSSDLSKVNVSFLILSSPSSPSSPSRKSLRASSLSKNSLKAGSRHVLFVQSVPFGDKKRLPEGSPNSLKHANYNSRIVFSERPVVSTIIDISTSLSRIFFATSVTAS